jgi:nitrate reductase assembly molybdenum cofactor insertion protein NarJ
VEITPEEIELEVNELPDILTLHSLEYLKLVKYGEVKDIANKKITAIMPIWKQNRSLGKRLSLRRKEFKGTITSGETTELNNLETEWADTVDALRDASDAIEAQIEALNTNQEILDFDILNNPLWNT